MTSFTLPDADLDIRTLDHTIAERAQFVAHQLRYLTITNLDMRYRNG